MDEVDVKRRQWEKQDRELLAKLHDALASTTAQLASQRARADAAEARWRASMDEENRRCLRFARAVLALPSTASVVHKMEAPAAAQHLEPVAATAAVETTVRSLQILAARALTCSRRMNPAQRAVWR